MMKKWSPKFKIQPHLKVVLVCIHISVPPQIATFPILIDSYFYKEAILVFNIYLTKYT